MSSPLQVTLPGGLLWEGNLDRSAQFRPLTGRLEMALADIAGRNWNLPQRVTTILNEALEQLGGKPSNQERIGALCVADRQFLMLRLAALLDDAPLWLNPICDTCSAKFDVNLDFAELPIHEARGEYPLASVDLGDKKLEVRLPTGADQARIVKMDEENAIRELLQACTISVDGESPSSSFLDQLSDEDIARIEDAMEGISPVVTTRLQVTCPECDSGQILELDPYALPCVNHSYFIDEIHTMAYYYHWSEAEILDLPSGRRRQYLHLIDRARSVST